METFTAWESRRGEVAANRARVAGIEKQLAAQEKKKTELESEIASLNIRLGRSSSDKLDPAVAVQIRNAIEKKEEEIAKKTKQLESGGTGEQRSPGVSKCQSLAKDARKTIDAIGKRAAEAQAAGIGR